MNVQALRSAGFQPYVWWQLMNMATLIEDGGLFPNSSYSRLDEPDSFYTTI